VGFGDKSHVWENLEYLEEVGRDMKGLLIYSDILTIDRVFELVDQMKLRKKEY